MTHFEMAKLEILQDGILHTIDFTPPQLLSPLLVQAGVLLPHPCGGIGRCGNCAVQVTGSVSPPTDAERRAGCRLSCQTILTGSAHVTLPTAQPAADGTDPVQPAAQIAGGVAVDIGTTTLEVRRIDPVSGRDLAQASAKNPQISIAADVMGRIHAAMHGQGGLLQQQVQTAVRSLLKTVGAGADRIVLTGNTTMLYLLTGRDPACLSAAPFAADHLFGETVRLWDMDCYLPRCMNAFVGADLACAVLSSGMRQHKTALLCDIGTNGELALWKNGQLYVTATAAGPAFEGGSISCGCTDIPGAIARVWTENGALQLKTIADAPAVGICGSGLIDLLAALLALGQLDETGLLSSGAVTLAPGIRLQQSDVRAVQLAKAAIAAGIQTLLQRTDTRSEQVEALYLAGSFGSHLDLDSAVAIGLIPRSLQSRVRVLGNAALYGAAMLLWDTEKREELRSLSDRAVGINLGGDAAFGEAYVEQMEFPAAENTY